MILRKINYPLIIGACILIVLFAFSLWPEHLSVADPYGKQISEYTTINGKPAIVIPPIPPCKEYPWGTDSAGRDLKSLIIYGSRQLW